MKKVAVGLSGGVDSATAALILKEQGYEVMGVTMHVFDHQTQELEAARRVAETLEIEHHIFDYRHDFDTCVIGDFIDAYEKGYTPNPCVTCNRHFKYDRLIKDSLALGCDYFATGHYAHVTYNDQDGYYHIYKAHAKEKDQSYNLYHLSQEVIKHLIFPLAHARSKKDVREKFAEVATPLSEKKDSLGICFIPRGSHTLYLKSRQSSAAIEGRFVDIHGKILGTHRGLCHYTIGQKRGLGQVQTGQHFVIDKKPLTNEIVLGEEALLYHTSVQLKQFNLIRPVDHFPLKVSIKVSQWSTLYEGQLVLNTQQDNAKDDTIPEVVTVIFDRPVRAPAPGQSLVCYIHDELIGGGIIMPTSLST